MSELLQFVFAGLTVGAIYAVVALGFTMIYNASGVVNFAQGEFVMLGAMLSAAGIAAGIPFPLAVLAATAATALLSVALYDLAIRPARGAPLYALVIITIAASILIRGLSKVAFGTSPQSLPVLFGDTPIRIGGAVLQPQSLVVMAGALAVFAVLYGLLTRTLLGRAIVATAANRMAAQLSGIDVERTTRLSFALSAAIGACAGVLIAPITLASYDMGTMLALKGFAAAILGGMGNPLGAVVGGVMVGLFEALASGYLSSQYKDATAFLVIVFVLFARPNGLFGKTGYDRV
ncbi:MAG: branched-chain amino acid ABC transporter permease [Burkholderiaceae bacterium]